MWYNSEYKLKFGETDMREERIYFDSIGHPFDMEVAGTSFCDETYFINRPKSVVTCMEYIIDGKGYINFDGKRFTAEKGDVYILHEGHDQFYYSDKNEPWTKIWINVRGDYMKQILNYYKIGNVNIFKNCPMEHYFREILAVASSGDSMENIIDKCNLIFIELVQAISRQFCTYRGQNTIAERLFDLINHDLNFSQSLDEYVEKLFCTKQYAITTFKNVYGITPHQYIIQRKMLAAENLLKNTNFSVVQIAEALNFCDGHYFSSFFKQQKGISPLKYRKQTS